MTPELRAAMMQAATAINLAAGTLAKAVRAERTGLSEGRARTARRVGLGAVRALCASLDAEARALALFAEMWFRS